MQWIVILGTLGHKVFNNPSDNFYHRIILSANFLLLSPGLIGHLRDTINSNHLSFPNKGHFDQPHSQMNPSIHSFGQQVTKPIRIWPLRDRQVLLLPQIDRGGHRSALREQRKDLRKIGSKFFMGGTFIPCCNLTASSQIMST